MARGCFTRSAGDGWVVRAHAGSDAAVCADPDKLKQREWVRESGYVVAAR